MKSGLEIYKNTVAYKFYERYGFEPFEQRMSIRLKEHTV